MRRAVVVVAAVLLAGLGLVVLLGVFEGAGDTQTRVPAGPGVAVPRQIGTLGALLQAGNVVLAYANADDARAARARALELGGAGTPALTAAGQAVLARQEPIATRFAALAYARALPLSSLADPALGAFVDRWLGEPASG